MHRGMRTLGPRALAALLLALAVAGCGVTTVSGTADTAKATVPRPTATTKATPYPTFDSTPQGTAPPAGPCDLTPSYDPTAQPPVQMGDLFVDFAFALAYPSRKLPDNIALSAPFKLQATSDPDLSKQLSVDPLTNPSLGEPGGGFMVTVCNTSKTTAHTLQSISMRLDSFTPYIGQLNEWNLCDGAFSRPTPTSGGCGGGMGGDGIAFLHATLTSATVGTTAVATQSSSGYASNAGVSLPASLQPNQSLDINLGLTPPTAAGTYTFSYALTADGAQTQFTQARGPMLLAPVAHKWGGQACSTNAAMLQQIPTVTDPPTGYICPEA